MENKIQLGERFQRINVLILGLLFLVFPLILSTVNTDAFAIAKQGLLIFVAILILVLFGVKSLVLRSVRLRRTPFDLPILALLGATLLSVILSVSRWDAIISFVPFLFSALLFFEMVNSAKKTQDFMFLSSTLIVGALISSAVTILSYLKIYILPFEFAKSQTFNSFGSLFDQTIYLLLILAFSLYLAWPSLKKREFDRSRATFSVGAILAIIGTVFCLMATLTLQMPQILPYQAGLQIGFASISQDGSRVIQGFLSGSGIGTFLTDFSRFKPASINQNAALWSVSFLRSSSFVLELLATTGLLGIFSFIFLAIRIIKSKPYFPPLILILVLSVVIPFSYPTIFLLFVLLGLYSIQEGLTERQKTKFFDVEARFMALRKGVFVLSETTGRTESDSNLLPFGFMALVLIFAGVFGYFSFKFFYSDLLFQESLIAASQNNAQKTYQLQTQSINTFPQRDGYHRIFSQINLSIANNIASAIPQGSKPTAQQQQTIYQLIQQSINSGRAATTISPQNALNWQNLSGIYRSLIGFGQNADSFALISNQQAIALDPTNPQEYINYGGIFYQLNQWDNAINQFQIAISLKPDFANAHYNLGHALEQKGNLQDALTQYQTVKSLVSNNKTSLDQINSEITALQAKIGQAANNTSSQSTSAQNQPPLEVNQPESQLPEQNPPVEIQGVSPSPSPKKIK